MSDQVNTLVLLEAISHGFKGLGNKSLTFDPSLTNILGRNGSGKTSFLNGYVWLMSRKDIWDKTDYEIQYRDPNGVVADHEESGFECVFSHNGRPVTVKKIYYQYWKKGENGGLVFDSMKNKYFINGQVRKTETDYLESISGLLGCDLEIFKVVTIPDYLLKMDQTKMRPILLRLMGGDVDESNLIQSDYAKFGFLEDELAYTSLDKYRTSLKSQKDELEKKILTIDAAIKENVRKIVPEQDWAALEEEKKGLKLDVESLVKQIAGLSEGEEFKEHNNRLLKKQELLNKNQTFKLEFERKQRDSNSKIEAKKVPFQTQINTNNATIAELDKKNKFARGQDIIIAAEIESIRNKYHAEKAKEYTGPQPWDDNNDHEHVDGELSCNECHRPYSVQELKDLRELVMAGFNNKKAEECETIRLQGIAKNNELLKLRQDVKDREKQIADLNTSNVELQAKIDAIKIDQSKAEDRKEYKAVLKELEALELLIQNPPKVDDEELQTRKSTYEERISFIDNAIASKKSNEELVKRNDELKAEVATISQEIFEKDRKAGIAKEFSHLKSEVLQKELNGKFNLIQFQLFDELSDGTSKEVCWPLLNGVPFATANTAGQIQMFMDVADTFSRAYNICLPRFVDKKESVTVIPKTNSQVITLSVVPFVPTPMRADSEEYAELYRNEMARRSQPVEEVTEE